MDCKIFLASLLAFLTLMGSCEGMSPGTGLEQRCHCIKTERRRIGKLIQKLEIYLPNSHCKEMEVVATMKSNKQKICLDPHAGWVRVIIDEILKRKQLQNPDK